MKRFFYSVAILSVLLPSLTWAQDIPVPAEDNPEPAIASQEIPVPEETGAENTTAPAEKTPQAKAAEDLIAFFEGLEKAVDSAEGDCKKISEAMRDYYTSKESWIAGLDYSTTDVDAQTVDVLHQKAVDFGKKLSACYDEESIPAQLHRYAGLGEEF